MKLRRTRQNSQAMTLVEVFVVIIVLAVLVAMILPALAPAKRHSGTSCVNNIKQIGLSFRIWQGDHNGKLPTEVSVADGGAMELAATGNAVAIFRVMSNELGTPKILVCQQDRDKTFTTNFNSGFSAMNISYFVGLDADTNNLQTFLSGDDNFEISGAPVKSGLLKIFSNTPIAWTTARHNRAGNIGLADGSVQQVTTSGLKMSFEHTALATNRLALP